MSNYFNFKHCARAFGGDVRLVVGTVIYLKFKYLNIKKICE